MPPLGRRGRMKMGKCRKGSPAGLPAMGREPSARPFPTEPPGSGENYYNQQGDSVKEIRKKRAVATAAKTGKEVM